MHGFVFDLEQVENGTTFWFGSARLNHPDSACVPTNLPPRPCDLGVNLYSSNDLYSWKFESRVVDALNSSENGLDLERPKVVRCESTRSYVMWLRGTPIYSGTKLKVGVLTAPTPRGPWRWEGNQTDPFHLVDGRYQFGDATLWSDSSTGKSYVYWRARTPQDGFRAMELNDACTGVRPETDTQVFRSPNREAPAFFSYAGGYYLWASGTLGWSPVQGYLYRGPTPLGPFNSTLGHGWHAYVKDADFNSTAAWHIRDGYLPSGNDWIPQRQTTVPLAQALCGNSTTCQGFTFKSWDTSPNRSTRIKVAFKTTSRVVPEGDPEGLQPPPIPEPGDKGNRKPDGQPGLSSYGSQSTYILPNPAYTAGSKLPQFIYMADRWQPSTKNFGLYVWLPLFIDPADPRRVSVVWYDYWRLDNVSSPF